MRFPSMTFFPSFSTVLSSVMLLLLAGCSALPPELESDEASVITQYSQWHAMMTHKGTPVRLGGVIVKVTNLRDKTRLEMVNIPIDASGKPDLEQEPQQRFAAYVDGFLDPVTFAAGRMVTFLGVSNGVEEKLVGEYPYTFPIMAVSGYHLWRVEERIVHDDPLFMPRCIGLRCWLPLNEIDAREGTIIKRVQ